MCPTKLVVTARDRPKTIPPPMVASPNISRWLNSCLLATAPTDSLHVMDASPRDRVRNVAWRGPTPRHTALVMENLYMALIPKSVRVRHSSSNTGSLFFRRSMSMVFQTARRMCLQRPLQVVDISDSVPISKDGLLGLGFAHARWTTRGRAERTMITFRTD